MKLTRIGNKGLVGLVGEVAEWAVFRKCADAFLRQNTHVDLQPQQGENGQSEQRQNDDIQQILHRLDHSSHDGLQSYNEWTTVSNYKQYVMVNVTFYYRYINIYIYIYIYIWNILPDGCLIDQYFIQSVTAGY